MRLRIMIIAALGGAAVLATTVASAQADFDAAIENNAQRLIEEGRQIFRYNTFGSEAFWGDTLQLHKAIAGEANGGVGPGVSPATALSVGLKVDADALLEDRDGSRRDAGEAPPIAPGRPTLT